MTKPGWWILAATILVMALGLTSIGVRVHRRQTAINVIMSHGGSINYERYVPDWFQGSLSRVLPLSLDAVEGVYFDSVIVTDEEMPKLVEQFLQFRQIRTIRLSNTFLTNTTTAAI